MTMLLAVGDGVLAGRLEMKSRFPICFSRSDLRLIFVRSSSRSVMILSPSRVRLSYKVKC